MVVHAHALLLSLMVFDGRSYFGIDHAAPTVPAIEFTDEFLSLEMPAQEPELYWEMLTNEACGVCKQNWEACEAELSSVGWRLGDDQHLRFRRVEFDQTLPRWRLILDGKLVDERVGYQSPTSLAEAWNAEKTKPRPEAVKAIATVNAGTIPRELLNQLDWFLLPSGPRQFGPVTLTVPLDITVRRTAKNGTATITFDPPISAKWGIVTESLKVVTYDGKKLKASGVWVNLEMNVR